VATRLDHGRRTRAFSERAAGNAVLVLTAFLLRLGLRGWQLHTASLSSVALCIGLWIRAKTVDQEERGNAERRALFAGLWAPTLWTMGNALEWHHDSRRRRRLRLPR
jgi:hypothetical protein